jgi:glycosylphosphatidylinositol phospholipase D
MQRQQMIFRALRRRLLARVSVLALRVALRRRGWAPGLLAAGLIGAPASALAQQIIDLATDAGVVLQGAGYSVSGAGDVNGDGIDDLIIGAGGTSFVVFGSDQGLPATIDLATDADVVIQGAGDAVSGAGDVNGDGIDDLIMGSPFTGAGGTSFVVFGSDQGFPATIDLATDADLTIQGAVSSASPDSSGFSVSGAGDVNGDGIDDLIIGAPGAGEYDVGASYVISGSDQGLPATIDLASDADVTIKGAAAFDRSGYSVSGAGDVNGDGIDDLIIGAPFAYYNDMEYNGASYVVFGSDQGLPATIDLASDADLTIHGYLHQDGISVSGAGDVNGDGIDDLIIGTRYAFLTADVSYVIFGSDQGFPATIHLASGADLTIQGNADQAGRSVSGAGDVNGDGIDDLLIGAPYADPNGRGASYVVFGTDQGFPATIDLATDADLIIQGATEYDSAGFSVSGAGDVNGDGIDDLIIGARSAGASYVVFGTAADPAAAIEDLIADVEAAGLEPRIERILTRTLDKALDSLDKGKERRAIIALRVFIIEVKVFRGKKIPEADADAWIADAEAIIDTLKAQKDRRRAPPHDAPSPMVEAQQ